MAAAVPMNDTSLSASSPATNVLQLANELHRVVLALHQDVLPLETLPTGSDLALLSTRLAHAVQSLLEPALVPGPPQLAYATACRKLGQDLLIRLGRIQKLCDAGGPVDQIGLCELWVVQDVEALGQRINDISSRHPDEASELR